MADDRFPGVDESFAAHAGCCATVLAGFGPYLSSLLVQPGDDAGAGDITQTHITEVGTEVQPMRRGVVETSAFSRAVVGLCLLQPGLEDLVDCYGAVGWRLYCLLHGVHRFAVPSPRTLDLVAGAV